jgi:hypothetical protein
MEQIKRIYRTLDQLQRRMWFCVAATVIVIAACGALFGALLGTSYTIDAQRRTLQRELSNQNVSRGDPHAVSMKNTGTIEIGGKVYGGEAYLNPRIPLFDSEGNMVNTGALIESLLVHERPDWAPRWLLNEPATTWMLAGFTTAWLLLIIWLNLTVPFALTILVTAIPVALCLSIQDHKGDQWALAFAGIGILTFTFMLLSRAALLLLNQSWQITAVAHTVLKEASRRGISMIFIVLLLAALPLLPLMLDPAAPLRYRIQTFMSLSLGFTFGIAAVMTLFFSCASVAFEIRDRQIWQLMTKPVARLNYLLGKWLGVVMLNGIILTIAGICTFTFIQYLRSLPVDTSTETGQLDVLAVEEDVLTARRGGKPVYPPLTPEQIRARIDKMIESDAELSRMAEVPMQTRRYLEQQLLNAHYAGLRSIPVGGGREFTFRGMKEAKRLASTVTLRYKFYILKDDEHATFKAGFIFNDDPNKRWQSIFVPTISHSLPIPSSWIRDDGTLKVAVYNLTAQQGGGAINFEENNLEVLYKAGTFEANFFRAVITIWTKLAFLAALGICCSTFLNFPVACLLSFTIFIAGMLGPYLAESLEWYYPMDTSAVDWSNLGMVIVWAFESLTRYIALGVVFLLSSFGEYRPTQSLIEGRMIEWTSVAIGFVKLGVIWSGLALVVGYTVLVRRQLAIYSGQG